MQEKKPIREPKQKRSAETCARIRKAALELFCKNGYYQTTTNAIAKAAGVPIGSLYSYFTDKDAIFLDILTDYNAMFVAANQQVLEQSDLYHADKKAWLRALIESLIKAHEESRDLNREIKILSFSRQDVAAFRTKNDEVTRKLTYDYFLRNAADFHIDDIESASIVAYTFISAVVDYLVFENPQADRERIITTAVEGLYRALGK